MINFHYRTWAFIASLFIAACLWPLPLLAQENDWRIDRFVSQIELQSDGVLKVAEEITADFGVTAKHGIYRDIPTVYEAEDGNPNYTEVELVAALLNDQPVKVEESSSETHRRFRLGDPSSTISGRQRYLLTYRVRGVVLDFDQYDEIYWNVTGNGWDVPIASAEAQLTVPGGIGQRSCYQGPLGSKESCLNDGQTFRSSRPLMPGEGLTIAGSLTNGLVPILQISPPTTVEDIVFDPRTGLIVLAWLTIAALAVGYRYHQGGRDVDNGRRTIVPEYESPGGLRPAELGVLVDERADTLDVTATIVDLAVRGFLRIEVIPKKFILLSDDYYLVRIEKNRDELLAYERLLLTELTAGAMETGGKVKLSSLQYQFHTKLKEVKSKLYHEVTVKKLFAANPDAVRTNFWLIATALALAGVSLINLGSIRLNLVILASGIGLISSGLLVALFVRSMPARTAHGSELYRQARGFELFLSTAERYRARFAENENLFNEIMPYAIIFGLTKKLAKAAKVMELTPPSPAWYIGPRPFSATAFAGDLDSFGRAISNAMASTPSGSGSGGGGFSGGGFGGGGGGSW